VLTTSYPAFEGDFSGHFVAAEAKALAESGHVLVAAAGCGSVEAPTNIEVRWLGGRALFSYPGALGRIRSNPLRLVWLPLVVLRALATLLRHPGPVVAHWLVPFGTLAAVCERRTKIAPQVVAHGSDVRLLGRAPTWLRELLVAELRRARAELTFVSHELKTELGHGLSLKLRDYLQGANVTPASLDVSEAPPSQAKARAELILSPSATIVVVIGRLIATKRISVALRSATLVPDSTVICIGDGPLRESLEREFPEVRFVGRLHRQQTLSWIRAADLLISASHLEGAPTAIREAMALGTRVVSSDVGDLGQWTRESDLLFLVPRASL
jgi:teichuronic acid biosynthesis glycosyltransferase TuaC